MPMTYNPLEDKPHCALCETPLDDDNSSREHVIPNAIGGRKSVRNFICKQCNDKTGADWDKELVAQLQFFCTMLNIRRDRGKNQPTPVETVKGEKLLLLPDGSMTIPGTVFPACNHDNKTPLTFQVKSMKDLKKMLPGLKRKYPKLDIGKTIEQAVRKLPEKEYLQDPWSVSLPPFLGGLAGRSVVKSCLALAYEAGLHIDDCEHAKNYLLSNGEPCFGHHNETDIVTNRPAKVFFHCIFVSGDPTSRQILAYAEYFGCQRIVARLSSNYDGDPFSCCHAIDPVTGQELDIEVHLNFTPEDIASIYAGEKVDNSVLEMALSSLLETYQERSRSTSIAHAVDDAAEFALANCGVRLGETFSDEQIKEFIGLLQGRLEPFLLHLYFSRTFSSEDLRNIAIKEGWSQSDEIECD